MKTTSFVAAGSLHSYASGASDLTVPSVDPHRRSSEPFVAGKRQIGSTAALLASRMQRESASLTTIFDLVHLSNLPVDAHSVLVGNEEIDSAGKIKVKLAFKNARKTKPLRLAQGQIVANKALQIALEHTKISYGLSPEHAATQLIDTKLAALRNAPDISPDATHLQDFIRAIGESIYQSQPASRTDLPLATTAQQKVGRMPTECMIHWLAALQNELGKTDDSHPAQRDALTELTQEARDRWLSHQMTFKECRSYFDALQGQCAALGFGDLHRLTKELKVQIPDSSHDDFNVNKAHLRYKTRLHDNIYGRVFDTAVVNALVENPPPATRRAMQQLGRCIADELRPPLDEADNTRLKLYREHINFLQDVLQSDHRPWKAQVPLLMAFQNETNPGKKSAALEAFLCADNLTGAHCLAIPYVAVSASRSTPWPNPAWREKANKHYQKKIVPQRARLDKKNDVLFAVAMNPSRATAQNIEHGVNRAWIEFRQKKELEKIEKVLDGTLLKTTEPGIMMAHQPSLSLAKSRHPAPAPGLNVRPDFEHEPELNDPIGRTMSTGPDADNRLPIPMQEALRHGLPFATGVSGLTHLLMHMTDHFNEKLRGKGNAQNDAHINPKDALIGFCMFVNYDGGHSIHEALWAANQWDKAKSTQSSFGLQLSDDDQSRKRFVSDYRRLVEGGNGRSENSEPGDDAISLALDEGFTKTIAYFNAHSMYASTVAP